MEDWWYYDGISSFALSGAYIEDGYNAKAWAKHTSHNIRVATQLDVVRRQSEMEPQLPSNASNALPIKISGPRHIASAFAYEACVQEPTYDHCLVEPCNWDAGHTSVPLQTYKTPL